MFYTSDFKNTIRIKDFDENVHNNFQKNIISAETSWKQYFKELLDEYCQCASLHGLRYLRDSSIPRSERFMWLFIILLCLYSSWQVVWVMYMQGATHSFALDINPQSTPIWEVPFPAVLVCSSYPIRKSVFDIAKEKDNLKYRLFSKMVCPNKFAFDPTEEFNETIGEEFFEFLQKAAIPCEDMIVNCHWRSKKRDCCSYFKPIVTAFGYCYVFNSLPGEIKYRNYIKPPGAEASNVDDYTFWSMENGYPKRDVKQAKLVRPLWAEFKGKDEGLRFDLVDNKEEWQENCSGSFRGFQVSLYAPNESYETATVIGIPVHEHTYIKLAPRVVVAEDNLRSIDQEERECLFDNEVKLDYISHYSQPSCRMECYIQEALQTCGCAVFTAHRMVGIYNHPYCNDSKGVCLFNVLSSIITTPLTKPSQRGNFSKCMCPPSCSWLSYDYQTNFEPIVTKRTLPLWDDEYNSSEENFARVSVFFNLQQFSSIDRKRTSTLGNFLGNCGGLLGLFLGFSFMSLFEVIYFAFIRPLNRIIILYRAKNNKH